MDRKKNSSRLSLPRKNKLNHICRFRCFPSRRESKRKRTETQHPQQSAASPPFRLHFCWSFPIVFLFPRPGVSSTYIFPFPFFDDARHRGKITSLLFFYICPTSVPEARHRCLLSEHRILKPKAKTLPPSPPRATALKMKRDKFLLLPRIILSHAPLPSCSILCPRIQKSFVKKK